jgi:hypothetical protein
MRALKPQLSNRVTGNVDAAPWMEIAAPHGLRATCTAACSMAIDTPHP